MSRKIAVNTFSGGMNKDVSFNKVDNKIYYDAENMRLITDGNVSYGAMSNVKGNILKFDLVDLVEGCSEFQHLGINNLFNISIKKYITLGDTLVLFATGVERVYADVYSTGSCYKLSIYVKGEKFGIYGADYYRIVFAQDLEPCTKNTNLVIDDTLPLLDKVNLLNNDPVFSKYYEAIYDDPEFFYIVCKNLEDASFLESTDSYGNVKYRLNYHEFIIKIDNFLYDNHSENIVFYTNYRIVVEYSLYSNVFGMLNLKSDYTSVVANIDFNKKRKVYYANGENLVRIIDIDHDYSSLYDMPHKLDSISDISMERVHARIREGGKLLAGAYSYAYQLFNNNGTITPYSSTDDIIYIANASEDSFGGSDNGDICGKSINIYIDNESAYSQDFEYIRFLSIRYSELNSEPEVNIIDEVKLNDSGRINVVDNGDYIGSITLAEYRVFNQTSIIPKAIETKNNYLFSANVKEVGYDQEVFDNWDTRIYPFKLDSSGVGNGSYAILYDRPDVTLGDYIYLHNDGTFTLYENYNSVGTFSDWEIPKEYGCAVLDIHKLYSNGLFYPNINDYFIQGQHYHPTEDIVGTTDYLYYSSAYGVYNYGATGKNIDLLFRKYKRKLSEDDPKNNTAESNTFPSMTQVEQLQPLEVYRIGIVLINNKGQRTPVKWITDFQMPAHGVEIDNGYITFVAPEIRVRNFPENVDDFQSYQIVIAHRDNEDVTIEATGFLSPVDIDSTNANELVACDKIYTNGEVFDSDGTDMKKNINHFFSAEPMFNDKNVYDYKNKKLVCYIYSEYTDTNNSVDNNSFFKLYQEDTNFILNSALKKYIFNINNVIDTKITNNEENVLKYKNQIGSYTYINMSERYGPNSTIQQSSKGTFPLLVLDDDLEPIAFSNTDKKLYGGSIIKNTDYIRYGGYSYSSRKRTKYRPASGIRTIVTGSTYNDTQIEYGDIYTQPFQMLINLFYRYGSNHSYQCALTSFLPSRIATAYRLDNINDYIDIPGSGVSADTINEMSFLQEKVTDGIRLYPGNYQIDVGDLYRYNNVYSQKNTSVLSLEIPDDKIGDIEFNNKIIASELKTGASSYDSWSVISPNDFIEVDSRYGDIVRLVAVKDKMFFFQKEAIGRLSIKERTLIKDDSQSSLVLGSGDVLSRYDYDSFFSGLKKYDDLIVTKMNIYYIDRELKRMFTIDNPESSISYTKGMRFEFAKVINDDSEIRLGYDTMYNELLVNIDNNTYIYNENLKIFIGKYSYVPELFISTKDGLLSTIKPLYDFSYYSLNSYSYMYQHNKGEYGIWYPGLAISKSKSTITIIINPNNNDINYFDNIEIRNSYIIDEDELLTDPSKTLDNASFSNSYIPEIIIPFNDYHSNILVNKVRMQIPLTQEGNRFVDSFIKIKLIYNNSGDGRFLLHDLYTYYRNATL